MFFGCGMAQAVSCWPLTVENLVSLCGICGGHSSTVPDCSPNSLVLSCQYHSTYIIREMNNRPVGGCSSQTLSNPIEMNMT
jgi:hypothetical protein